MALTIDVQTAGSAERSADWLHDHHTITPPLPLRLAR